MSSIANCSRKMNIHLSSRTNEMPEQSRAREPNQDRTNRTGDCARGMDRKSAPACLGARELLRDTKERSRLGGVVHRGDDRREFVHLVF